ncbi:MAG: helix-turn-helix domain-containing protein [Oscillospiraceae bacterium]|nr:helix-turn-helix domain-containing protein [Oscillospiraceae bacterium]
MSIGQNILEFRKAKGSTQEELANAVGVSAQAVSKWENGGAPDAELLPAIADFLNVSVDKLFGRNVSASICDSVHDYIFDSRQSQGFDRAFNIYHALHDGLMQPQIGKLAHASHNCNENGYSFLIPNGYGNFVKREFWQSVNLETAGFAQNLFELLSEPGILEVLFAILRRKVFGPANFEMIKSALINAEYTDEVIQSCLEKLVEREILTTEMSPYDEIGKTYQISDWWYLGLCAVICAAQALKISLPGFSCYLGRGAWPIQF